MRRLILKMSMSLDGFVAGPNGELDWMMRRRSEQSTAWLAEMFWQAGVHAMGSRTYYDMAGFWPSSTDPLAAPMNEIPKVVFTRQAALDPGAVRRAGEALPAAAFLDAASWADVEVANGDLAAEVGRLKAQGGGDILAHGGAGFARSLARLDLVDEYRLIVHPVVLGAGLPIFSELAKPLELRLMSTTIFGSGVVAQVYRRG